MTVPFDRCSCPELYSNNIVFGFPINWKIYLYMDEFKQFTFIVVTDMFAINFGILLYVIYYIIITVPCFLILKKKCPIHSAVFIAYLPPHANINTGRHKECAP